MSLAIKHLHAPLASADTVGGTTVGTTETQFSAELAIKANTARPGDLWLCFASVDCPSTNGSDTLTLKAYVGPTGAVKTGIQVADQTAIDVANNASISLVFLVACVAAGTVSVATFAGGGISFANAATAVSKTLSTSIATDAQVSTLTDQAIGVTATWNASSASNSARIRAFHALKFPALPSQ